MKPGVGTGRRIEEISFLPPASVPLLVAAGRLAWKLIDWARGRGSLDHVLFAVPDGWHALGPAALLVFAGLRRLMCQRLGGTTGDTAGALVELAEAAVLLLLALSI